MTHGKRQLGQWLLRPESDIAHSLARLPGLHAQKYESPKPPTEKQYCRMSNRPDHSKKLLSKLSVN